MAWLQVIPILEIPGLGNQAAKTVCDEMKIKTQGDKKLEDAKKIVYLRGFTDGVMIVGPHKGKKVRTTLHSADLAWAKPWAWAQSGVVVGCNALPGAALQELSLQEN